MKKKVKTGFLQRSCKSPDSTPPVGHRWIWVARLQLAGPPVAHPPSPTTTWHGWATSGPHDVCYLGLRSYFELIFISKALWMSYKWVDEQISSSECLIFKASCPWFWKCYFHWGRVYTPISACQYEVFIFSPSKSHKGLIFVQWMCVETLHKSRTCNKIEVVLLLQCTV